MDGRANCTPTPEEIKKACEEIRQGWSKEKWKNQSNRVAWTLPLAKSPSLKERTPGTS